MINYKIEKGLVGRDFWSRISSVFVKGIPDQPNVSGTEEGPEREGIIQSWKNIAVFRATSVSPANFYIGFFNNNTIQYLKNEFSADMDFGMRVGPDDMNFMALPVNLVDNVKLELIEITSEDDPKYVDLILI